DYLDLANHCKSIDQEIRFCINSIGVLEGSILEKPERKISEIDIEKLSYSFQVNALPILLLTKYLFPCLRKSSSLRLIQISAKLGSIQDNELGGWYSYRLSKAAGNMGLKNISIELKRYNPSAVCISIHPGTCDTKFTQNFLESAKSRYKVHTATESANNILEVIRNLNPSDSGQFFNWDGQKLDF
ncbi:MAG: SDR family NAD(P)-dependent oxidoreductase, partial [Bdellovibrionota bacterium]|nr:SDR family NAD(P)-dependent oxidoreductase [Bdellovibrionota bacterium]